MTDDMHYAIPNFFSDNQEKLCILIANCLWFFKEKRYNQFFFRQNVKTQK